MRREGEAGRENRRRGRDETQRKVGTRRDRKRRRGELVFKGVKCKPTQVCQSELPHRGSRGERTRCHARRLGFHFHLHHRLCHLGVNLLSSLGLSFLKCNAKCM